MKRNWMKKNCLTWRKVGVAVVLVGLLVRSGHAEVLPEALGSPDNRPPRLLEMTPPDEMTPRSATLFWTTDEASSTRVEYGPTPDYGFYSPPNPTRVTHHGVVLVHLKSATTYYYRLISADAVGNTVYSENQTFTTPPDGQVKAVRTAEQHAATLSTLQIAID